METATIRVEGDMCCDIAVKISKPAKKFLMKHGLRVIYSQAHDWAKGSDNIFTFCKEDKTILEVFDAGEWHEFLLSDSWGKRSAAEVIDTAVSNLMTLPSDAWKLTYEY